MKRESNRNPRLTPSMKVALTAGLLSALALGAVFLLLVIGKAQTAEARQAGQQGAAKTHGDAKLIARGKYIVEGLSACGDCHTPRNRNGDIDRTKWLAGAPVFYGPAQPIPGWPVSAPRIAGLPPGSDAEIITLLTTSVWKNNQAPRPPMPRFRMTREDAQAVVAYLKSL